MQDWMVIAIFMTIAVLAALVYRSLLVICEAKNEDLNAVITEQQETISQLRSDRYIKLANEHARRSAASRKGHETRRRRAEA
jgi:hypothetical protein